ncbi:MAG: hypothetical protein ACOZB3_00965 [Calditrichota bacterium]
MWSTRFVLRIILISMISSAQADAPQLYVGGAFHYTGLFSPTLARVNAETIYTHTEVAGFEVAVGSRSLKRDLYVSYGFEGFLIDPQWSSHNWDIHTITLGARWFPSSQDGATRLTPVLGGGLTITRLIGQPRGNYGGMPSGLDDMFVAPKGGNATRVGIRGEMGLRLIITESVSLLLLGRFNPYLTAPAPWEDHLGGNTHLSLELQAPLTDWGSAR